MTDIEDKFPILISLENLSSTMEIELEAFVHCLAEWGYKGMYTQDIVKPSMFIDRYAHAKRYHPHLLIGFHFTPGVGAQSITDGGQYGMCADIWDNNCSAYYGKTYFNNWSGIQDALDLLKIRHEEGEVIKIMKKEIGL